MNSRSNIRGFTLLELQRLDSLHFLSGCLINWFGLPRTGRVGENWRERDRGSRTFVDWPGPNQLIPEHDDALTKSERSAKNDGKNGSVTQAIFGSTGTDAKQQHANGKT